MLADDFTNQFKRDRTLVEKRGLDVLLLNTVMRYLIAEEPLTEKYKDYALFGDYKGYRECHIQIYFKLQWY